MNQIANYFSVKNDKNQCGASKEIVLLSTWNIWNMTYSSWFLDVENKEPCSAFVDTSLWLPNIKPGGTIIILLDSKTSVKPSAIRYCQHLINGCRSFTLFTKYIFFFIINFSFQGQAVLHEIRVTAHLSTISQKNSCSELQVPLYTCASFAPFLYYTVFLVLTSELQMQKGSKEDGKHLF